MSPALPDLAAPLRETTFVAIDLETTGGSPLHDRITEVGAIKFRGGEQLGAFQTLVDPGVPIPPEVVYLTGITEAAVGPAPRIEAVLPGLLEFVGGAVVVAHNARFDLAFLHASLRRSDYARLANPVVDTCGLARRLLVDEVPDFRLSTLARHLRTNAQPCHRALADAAAAAELLHLLLERVGSTGVTSLDDLLTLPSAARHPQARKLRLTADLPRAAGIYVFRDVAGDVLFVGRARNLRQRVRAYFSSSDRRWVGPLLRELHTIEHRTCTDLEAVVLELRTVRDHDPRYNRGSAVSERPWLIRLTEEDARPRLSIVRRRRAHDDALHLGPMPRRAAVLVVDAIESVLPLRRCRHRGTAGSASAPTCPCAGADAASYRRSCDVLRDAVAGAPELLLDPISARARTMVAQGRDAEAAILRARGEALARALDQEREVDELRRMGRVIVELPGGAGAILDAGRLEAAWQEGSPALPPEPTIEPSPSRSSGQDDEEVAYVARWTAAHRGVVRIRPVDR